MSALVEETKDFQMPGLVIHAENLSQVVVVRRNVIHAVNLNLSVDVAQVITPGVQEVGVQEVGVQEAGVQEAGVQELQGLQVHRVLQALQALQELQELQELLVDLGLALALLGLFTHQLPLALA